MKIDDKNFEEYFFDIRKHSPQPGQVMARYTASAELVAGKEKLMLIDMLKKEGRIEAAQRFARKVFLVSENDVVKLLLEITSDMLSGFTNEDVMKKPYKYTLEMFFYTKPEYIPMDDKHWSSISIKTSEKSPFEITMKIVEPNPT